MRRPATLLCSVIFCLQILQGSAGSLLKSLEVPQFTFVSGTVTLRCVYDMGSSKLYSLKWYHNNTEFYRYVPTERNGPVNIGPTNIFTLHEVSRDARHVTLSLSRLTSAATGAYRCEVLAEHPSFRTESMQSYMTVLSHSLSPPLIKRVREIYEPSDQITVGCQPQKMEKTEPMPKIVWLIDGKQARGSVVVECRLSLGEFEERASKTIRVRMEHKSLASAPSTDLINNAQFSELRDCCGGPGNFGTVGSPAAVSRPLRQRIPQERQCIPQERQCIPKERQHIPQERQHIPQERQHIPQERQHIPQERLMFALPPAIQP
ncbi:uncharacterized protein LOC125178012 [Hyalella azteca]|uniref:Uncharacterized protein LOC125178012 n=1 Tax=Hyalella azteca TaxID=294128 RepID=A0A979FIM2_HYAAZ|nr:uncharacterized protein LOC125178012 [Hyalella azteca]